MPTTSRHRFLFVLLALQPLLVACGLRAATTTIHVDAGRLLRSLPDRALVGQNLSFANRANGAWDPERGRFNEPFWQRFSAIDPGLLRFPGGNWCYGFHFDLARQGIPHWVNGSRVTPHYRPQDFLATLRALPGAVALIHVSPIWSSPEEAAAFVAYMVGEPTDGRAIGRDSWQRIDPRTGEVIDWQTVSHWAGLRESDGQEAYRGTLYLQVGNEEWSAWCADGVCEGQVDYYGRRHPKSQMVVVDDGLKDPVSGVAVAAYWPKYRATYRKIRGLFAKERVPVGALIHARPDGIGGADAFFRTAGGGGKRWNVELLGRLNGDSEVTTEFLTLHTYMYDRRGWEKDFPEEGTANLLAASDHLAARIEKIFAYSGSRHYAIMVTEFNAHMSGSIAASSLLNALFYVDFTMSGFRNPDVVGMARWQTANWRQNRGFRGEPLFATDGAHRAGEGQLWKMGAYHAAKLLGALHKRVVSVTVEGSPSFRPRDLSGTWVAAGETRPWWVARDLPIVTAVATLSDDSDELALLVLNKNTRRSFGVEVRLDGFAAASAYTSLVLSAADAGGHADIFEINPWRLPPEGSCAPPGGGCSPALAAETGERVALVETKREGAGAAFRIELPAHSATLLRLGRADAVAGRGS